jgi:hypothetical protein
VRVFGQHLGKTIAIYTLVVPMLLVLSTMASGTSVSTSTHPPTLIFYARGTEPQTTTASGVNLHNGPPIAGDYLIDTYKLYPGSRMHHANGWTSTVALHCLLTAVSKPGLGGRCEAVLVSGGSMLVAYGPETFRSGANHTYEAPIIFGTGIWAGAAGHLISHDIG